MDSIVERFQALGFQITSTASGITVGKSGDRFLYYQGDDKSLSLAEEVVLGDFLPKRSQPIQVALTLQPIGDQMFAVNAKTRLNWGEDIPYLLPVLEGVLAFFPRF